MNQVRYDRGFLIVATCHAMYKNSALSLIDSLDEYYPECKIMVVCPEEWREEFEQYTQVVEIRCDGPDERRTKLWALQHTVFEKTCYLDADMEVVSDEIQNVWDLLDDEHDMAFTVINPRYGASTAIYSEDGDNGIRDNNIEKHLRYHGGFFLWWHNDDHLNSIEAAKLWWTQWNNINKSDEFWEDNQQYYRMNKGWDQFTLWHICRIDLPELKIQEIAGGLNPESMKWNCSTFYVEELGDVSPVILHYPINREMMNVGTPDSFFSGGTRRGVG